MTDEENEEIESIYFTYPSDGTKKSVSIGRVIIDFYNGTVKLPDGTEEKISDSLKVHKLKQARSLSIYSSQDAKYGLDDRALKPISAAKTHAETFQKFTRVVIDIAIASAQISVWACTHPAATVRIM